MAIYAINSDHCSSVVDSMTVGQDDNDNDVADLSSVSIARMRWAIAVVAAVAADYNDDDAAAAADDNNVVGGVSLLVPRSLGWSVIVSLNAPKRLRAPPQRSHKTTQHHTSANTHTLTHKTNTHSRNTPHTGSGHFVRDDRACADIHDRRSNDGVVVSTHRHTNKHSATLTPVSDILSSSIKVGIQSRAAVCGCRERCVEEGISARGSGGSRNRFNKATTSRLGYEFCVVVVVVVVDGVVVKRLAPAFNCISLYLPTQVVLNPTHTRTHLGRVITDYVCVVNRAYSIVNNVLCRHRLDSVFGFSGDR